MTVTLKMNRVEALSIRDARCPVTLLVQGRALESMALVSVGNADAADVVSATFVRIEAIA